MDNTISTVHHHHDLNDHYTVVAHSHDHGYSDHNHQPTTPPYGDTDTYHPPYGDTLDGPCDFNVCPYVVIERSFIPISNYG